MKRVSSAPESTAGSSSAALTQANPGNKAFREIWYALNVLLLVSLLTAVYSIVWEYSTRRYLKGFSDAIISAVAPPEERVKAILSWMSHGPARQPGRSGVVPSDPTDTLNYASLVQVCGSATNAFVNLADSVGIAARRLLLLTPANQAKHVVAEVLIDGRWVVVDPAFRVIPRGAGGKLLTREDLPDPATFVAATRGIPHYDPDDTFERTAHVRLSRIRFVSHPLRALPDRLLPGWDDSTTVSLLIERRSLATMVVVIILTLSLSIFRVFLRRYGEKFLAFHAVRIRDQVRSACTAFLHTAS
jgi:hypothetical protein